MNNVMYKNVINVKKIEQTGVYNVSQIFIF